MAEGIKHLRDAASTVENMGKSSLCTPAVDVKETAPILSVVLLHFIKPVCSSVDRILEMLPEGCLAWFLSPNKR